MPGKVKVKILAGRNLPVMDRSSDTTDAYVEIKLGNTTYKTDVCRKSLNPQWNSEWYRFEVDDAELQDEPLQIRLMDHDTYSANDAIGKVYLDLNPLLLPGVPPLVKNIWTLEASMSSTTGIQGGSVMTGWIPVYDTMHGIRGEVNIIVKVELFSDFNKFRQSSCGVQFFCSPIIPHGYHAQVIHGFVEELVVNDDPEYKWIDKIRTPRASNEARQTLFFKLSGEVQRKIGLKALDLGGNAVIGYHQCFDLEGESGIVARGIGTAVSLVKMHDISSVPVENPTAEELALLGLPPNMHSECLEIDDSVPLLSYSPNRSPIPETNFQSTRVSNKFPGHGGKLHKPTKPMMKLSQYRSAGSSHERTRKMSQPSNISFYNMKKCGGSSQSLSDDYNEEMSLRSMLEQEDMRGEAAGNRFSRGLKNLRYLPHNMLSRKVSQFKARFSDSLDEESDLDSSFSSTWSIGGSESTKSSIPDSYVAERKKKLTHKRNASEGMAAILIRSVHSRLALDSVREVCETSTPSPVNFSGDILEFGDPQTKHKKDIDKGSGSGDSSNQEDTNSDSSNKIHQVQSKLDLKYDDGHLVSISSFESDTSSSEDDPSESSTNYNILDDSVSIIDPGSPVTEECRPPLLRTFDNVTPRSPSTTPSIISLLRKENLEKDTANDETSFDRKHIFGASMSVSTEPTSSSVGSDILFQKRNTLEETELISYTDSADSYHSTSVERNMKGSLTTESNEMPGASNIASAILFEEKNTVEEPVPITRSDIITITSSMTSKQTEFLEEQEQLDNPGDSKPAAASTPTENDDNRNMFFPDINLWPEPYLQRSTSLNEQAIRRSVTPTIKIKQKSESFKTEKESKLQIFKQLNIPQNYEQNMSDSSTPTNSEFRLDDKTVGSADLLLSHSPSNDEGKSTSNAPLIASPIHSSNISTIKLSSEDDIIIPSNVTSIVPPNYSLESQNEAICTSSGIPPSTSPNSCSITPTNEASYLPVQSLGSDSNEIPCTDHEWVKKEKSPKRVKRTETVIYKGPPRDKERIIMPAGSRDITGKVITAIHDLPKPKPVPIITAASGTDDNCHLTVPVLEITNVNVKSTFTLDEIDGSRPESPPTSSLEYPFNELRFAKKLGRKYKQHCMLELIKIIDTKMLVQPVHYDRKDSTRSKRRRRDKMNISLSPSPDSVRKSRLHRKRSVSKSPEGSLHSQTRSPPITHPNRLLTSPIAVGVSATKRAIITPKDGFETNHDPTVETHDIINLEKPHKVSRQTIKVNSEIASNSLHSNNSHLLHANKNLTPLTNNEKREHHESYPTAAIVLASNSQADLSSSNNTNIELNNLHTSFTNTTSLLAPVRPSSTVYKSHSACSLRDVQENVIEITKTTNAASLTDNSCVACLPPSRRQQEENVQHVTSSSPAPQASTIPTSVSTKVSQSPAMRVNSTVPMYRRSSDSDLSITPKGNSLTGSDRSSMGGYLRPATAVVRPMNQEALDMLEYPFITMQQYPPGFILHLGGTVSARSVKLLGRISNIEEPESRDAWWTEIRMEVRSHARALACNVVLGYREDTSICDDVCVLSAAGTAAVINLQNTAQEPENASSNRVQQQGLITTSMDKSDFEREKAQQKIVNTKNEKNEKNEKHEKCDDASVPAQPTSTTGKTKHSSENNEQEVSHPLTISSCSICHIPYSETSVPFRVNMLKCAICRRGKVPDVLFTTIELPETIPITGRGCFLQATVCKPKRDLRGELNAKEISDCLPFLEYELHSLLLNKLKVKGMNALFGLRVQVSIGERLLIGMATGTAVYLSPLPAPAIPKVTSGNSWNDEHKLIDIQKSLIDTVKKNREFYQLKSIADIENGRPIATSDTDDSEDELPELDLGAGNKDACVLEVDDIEDIERISMLMDNRPPADFHVVNTQTIPGLEDLEIVRNLQMFTQLWRAKIPAGQPASVSTKYFSRLLQSVYFKLRRMVPCALCDLQFKVELPEQDEIQLSVVGMALGLGEPTKLNKYKRKVIPHSMSRDQVKKTDDGDLIFNLDEDHVVPENAVPGTVTAPNTPNSSILHSTTLNSNVIQRPRPRSPMRTRAHVMHKHRHVPLKERYGVDITPLSYMPGGKIDRYLGNLNFFFIRESTAIREGGGLSGFVHSFVTEVLAIIRAHVTALGGNAMVAYFMTECVLCHSAHKNQGQCLINVGGDVVSVSYFADDKHPGSSIC